MGSIIDYTVAFRARLLECTNVSHAETLDRYMAGLKQGTRDWVLIHDPALSTRQHAGQKGTTTRTILEGRPMLLHSRVLVDQCHLATASSYRAGTTLPAVSLTHKGTASSLANGSSNPSPSNNHRARIRANIIRSLRDSASSVVVPAIKPRSVN